MSRRLVLLTNSLSLLVMEGSNVTARRYTGELVASERGYRVTTDDDPSVYGSAFPVSGEVPEGVAVAAGHPLP